ncbi:nitric oxide-associated protein 1 [Ceratina calcarata]|uniref:Nitric oxide-associated protein 1 n=1 Tax=Ceratina calcarata TaxID=156304 RepID=A0AAJ7J372_9HYME|nr:nitric oxide-associated protein 1 [Ceratina calcarata]
MRLTSIRFWLSQLRARNSRCDSTFSQFRRNTFSKSDEFKPDPRVLALRDKLLYCDYLDYENIKMGYLKRRRKYKKEFELAEKAKYEKLAYEPAVSVMLNDPNENDKSDIEHDSDSDEEKPLYMPYAAVTSYQITETNSNEDTPTNSLNNRYIELYEQYLEAKKDSVDKGKWTFEEFLKSSDIQSNVPKGELWKIPTTWMSDYEEFDDALIDENWNKYYGTPDPNSNVSSVPCGGCGALLHCRDPAIPGYLPSELFTNKKKDDLKTMVCQRCHFLKFYNASLEVKVSIEDYPKLLRAIKTKKCAVILIIDLTDFPCSIWPDLKSVLHPFTPIFLVGNKVDLLPRDCPKFIDHIKQSLLDTVVDVTGVKRENFTHVQLTSAKTGYGIEQLINKLQYKWRHRGDVYLIGCTNVGKSSMFNILLNSDYCKIQALDLIQRATVSAWPGTTLNLLKFPILNPSGRKAYLRTERLKMEQVYRMELSRYRDYQFKATGNIEFTTLQDEVGRTFTGRTVEEAQMDPFSEKSHAYLPTKPVFDESKPEYENSRWCYDTPGTIQKDQVLDLLTTDELLSTLPQQIITPRSFTLKLKQTVFLAGLGRLDYLEGEYFIRCTLFASKELPITICHTVDADEVYDRLLETDAFVVPANNPERLKKWPKLLSKEFKMTGIYRESAADVVLSSSGWIAVTPQENDNVLLRAWTPQGRGIHLRSPALLRYSVRLCGSKVPGTPVYSLGRRVYVNV